MRAGRPADAAALRTLQSHLHAPSPALLAHGLRAGSVLVSTADGGAPVGYLLPVDGDGLHLAELVVHPDRRREGRARRLLRRALAGADGRATLFVAADNDPALSLYRDEGFRPVERRHGFYDDGTDALLMAWTPDPHPERGDDRGAGQPSGSASASGSDSASDAGGDRDREAYWR